MDERVMQFRVGVDLPRHADHHAILLVMFGKLPSLSAATIRFKSQFDYAGGRDEVHAGAQERHPHRPRRATFN